MSLKTKKEPYVITANVDRPDARNAINFEVMDKLEHLLTEIENDSDLRRIILTGSGNSFVSGGDLREFHQIKDASGAKKMTRRMLKIIERIKNLPCWTLAALNGHTYGGGWELSLAFDFRVASSSANIGFTQGKFYLPPGWGGITNLKHAVGKHQAKYWLASQKVITADVAQKAGFLQDVFEENEYDTRLDELKQSLTLNDRAFIEYVKSSDIRSADDEVDPFSSFWENDTHQRRVEQFLNKE
jgi:enoyl-CoA hydratase/carnithine racemase